MPRTGCHISDTFFTPSGEPQAGAASVRTYGRFVCEVLTVAEARVKARIKKAEQLSGRGRGTGWTHPSKRASSDCGGHTQKSGGLQEEGKLYTTVSCCADADLRGQPKFHASKSVGWFAAELASRGYRCRCCSKCLSRPPRRWQR